MGGVVRHSNRTDYPSFQIRALSRQRRATIARFEVTATDGMLSLFRPISAFASPEVEAKVSLRTRRLLASFELMAEQESFFGTNDFADNPEPRVPCVLVLDTSGSMEGEPIRLLNEALSFYKSEVSADPLASKRVEVAIVTFGPVQVTTNFTTAANFNPPTLVASGDTPLGAAVDKAIQMVADRKKEYKANGIGFYRPWIFLITDGAPNPGDSWEATGQKIKDGEAAKNFVFFAVGVEGANFDVLKKMCARREPLRLNGLRFTELFQWLSNSQSSVSKSQPGEAVPLAPTSGWAVVD